MRLTRAAIVPAWATAWAGVLWPFRQHLAWRTTIPPGVVDRTGAVYLGTPMRGDGVLRTTGDGPVLGAGLVGLFFLARFTRPTPTRTSVQKTNITIQAIVWSLFTVRGAAWVPFDFR